MHPDVLRIPVGAQLAARVLVGADELLLLRVHRDDGLVRVELVTDGFVDVFELRVPIRMLRAFEAFAIRLQAVPSSLSSRATIFMLV